MLKNLSTHGTVLLSVVTFFYELRDFDKSPLFDEII